MNRNGDWTNRWTSSSFQNKSSADLKPETLCSVETQSDLRDQLWSDGSAPPWKTQHSQNQERFDPPSSRPSVCVGGR